MNLFLYDFFPLCIIDKTGEILGEAVYFPLLPAPVQKDK